MSTNNSITTTKEIKYDWGLRTGDIVVAEIDGLGEGVIVGFTDYTGEPDVYFYSRQKVLCIGHEQLVRLLN